MGLQPALDCSRYVPRFELKGSAVEAAKRKAEGELVVPEPGKPNFRPQALAVQAGNFGFWFPGKAQGRVLEGPILNWLLFFCRLFSKQASSSPSSVRTALAAFQLLTPASHVTTKQT